MKKEFTKDKKLKYTQEEYEKYILDNYNFEVLSEYKGSEYPVEIRCLKCGGITHMRTERIKERGCPYCNGRQVLKGFNDLSITRPEIYNILTDKEDCLHLPYSRDEVSLTCPTCGKVYIKELSHINKNGLKCPICDDGYSYPEKFFRSLLIQGNITFESQKVFDFLKDKKYDFFIPSKNIIIETHGGQHYTDVFRYAPGKYKKRNEKENDKLKREMAIKNGIDNYFEIDCQRSEGKYIKDSIINSGVLDAIGIKEEDIDFNKCEIDANNSYAKQVWDLWNSGKYTAVEISKILGIGSTTTCQYLRTGTKLGVCNYNGQEERNRASAHPVVLTNTGEVFDYIEDAIKKYGKLNISGCCRKEIISAGKMEDGTPMVWRYLEDYNENEDYTYKNKTNKQIICLETKKIYSKIYDATKEYGLSEGAISTNLQKRNSYAGRDKLTKMPLHWVYYEDYLKMSEEEIKEIINSTKIQYSSIICLNDLQIFASATEALNHCGLKNVTSITDCCKGKRENAGIVNGEKGEWMYYKDYIEKYGETVN